MNPLLIFFAIAGTGTAAVGGYVAYDRYQENQKTEIAKLAEPQVKAPKVTPKVEPEQKTVVEKPAAPIVPSFDIVRVEKDGSMLVAGQAEPASEITLLNRDKPIGKAKSDETGAFVVLPDNPLQGADNEISIRSKLADGKLIDSQQRVAVAVPEQGEALVALVEPGKPVEILQKPEPKPEPKSVVVAKAPEVKPEPASKLNPEPEVLPVSVPKPLDQQLEEPAKEAEAEVVVDTPAPAPKPTLIVEPVTIVAKTKPEPKEAVVAKVEEVPVDDKPEPALKVVKQPTEKAREESKKRVARLLEVQKEPAAIVEEVVETPEPVEIPALVEKPEPVEIPEPVETAIVATPTPEPIVEEPPVEQVVANIEEKKPESAKIVEPSKSITVDAVEVENDTLFIAGKASPNETVRIYVDDKLVGDVKSSDGGNWLLQQTKPLGPGQYNIRVDLLKKGSAEVAARAAVPFAVEDLTPTELAEAEVGNVIIRKDDNLWTIAQRLYGDGRRYTSIYQQNKGQIKNPQLIFPGQIFKVPSEGQIPGAAKTVDQVVVVAPSAKPQAQ